MGFNIAKFREGVLDAAVEEANRRTRNVESVWLGRMSAAVDRMIAVGRQLMTYRTWNFASSIVAVLFYDGKILGVETDGYQFVTRTKSSTRTRNYYWYKRTKLNPAYGYVSVGGGSKPWKYAVNNNLDKVNGRDWAHFAVEQLQEKMRGRKGYDICIAIGMPYAWVKVGNPYMIERSYNIIESAANAVLGKTGSKIHNIRIDLGQTTF